MIVKLEAFTPNPKELIRKAVSITTMTEWTSDWSKFFKMLIKRGAESPLEHVSFTFFISDVSRALTHQLVRHRIASYTQESQRYVKYDKGFRYVIPPSIEKDDELNNVFRKHMVDCANIYHFLVVHGVPPEDARFVLPNACHTSIYVTMNLRELRHFFKVRLSQFAQWEIRELARQMYEIVKKIIPEALYDINVPSG
jgi:thymidylate synthase (FAD)